MAIRNWRVWHWVFVSLLVGAGVGLVMSNRTVDDPSLPSVSFREMVRKLERRTDAGESTVTAIRVSPVIADHNGMRVQSVMFSERLKNKTTGQWEPVRQFRTVTPVPLSPASPTKDYGVLNYLADKKKEIPSLDWRFEWWLAPRNLWSLSLGGSFVLIGVIWPMTLKGLVKLGLAEPPDERMDLSSVRTVEAETTAIGSAKPTADDVDKLDALNAAMAANVAGMGMTAAPGAAADEPEKRPATPEIRKLGTGVEEPVVTAGQGEEKQNEFQGEFYPVVKPKQPK